MVNYVSIIIYLYNNDYILQFFFFLGLDAVCALEEDFTQFILEKDEIMLK